MGTSTYTWMRVGVIAAALVSVGLGVALIGRFGQEFDLQENVRSARLLKWADGDPVRMAQVEQFTKLCLINEPLGKSEESSDAAVTIRDCAESNGYLELVEVIREADSDLESMPVY